MPYGKMSIYRKRGGGYGRRYNRRISRKFKPASGYRRGGRFLRRIGEIRHKDTSFSLGSAQTVITVLNDIAQGSTLSQRNGSKIFMKNIHFKGYAAISTSVTNYTRFTLMLVRDKQQVADTAPSLSDIMTSSTDPESLLNTASLGRYHIIWRKLYVLRPVSSGNNIIQIKRTIPIYKSTRYNGGNAGDINTNGLYMVAITDASVNYPTISLNCRLNYQDHS